ncbi:MAG: hypothetical protein P9L92_18955 [Candidatus Electryonea clarkiae]|nr:hypothetical protein [Candidatus Electryonea clarkiae]MDP8285709.1 hypothetical protein [Candidatus Electryonea clarkiae]
MNSTKETLTVHFKNLIGQEKISKVLSKALLSDRLAHAYLFLGAEGVGKEAAAIDFARALICDLSPGQANEMGEIIPCEQCSSCSKSRFLQHPNLKILFPMPKPKDRSEGETSEEYSEKQSKRIEEALDAKVENYYSPLNVDGGKEILVEHIRTLRKEFSMTAFSGNRRVVIISQTDRLRKEAANAFLKLLEEPPVGTVFILISSHESRLLSTIYSRCQAIRFPPLPGEVIKNELQEKIGVDEQQAKTATRLSYGSWYRALEWASGNPVEEIEKAVEVFRLLAKGDPGIIDAEVDKLTGRDKAGNLPRLLGLMIEWLRDVQRYDSSSDENKEQSEEEALVRFANFCSGRDFAMALEEIDQARLDLTGNVQPAVVIHTLLVSLRKILFAPAVNKPQ